eukprot:gnl/TRDRNA2_/TRDRNA2_173575_c0_seq4.p1 gnl/TRDRNA2_/TRDRNA2_173575_c0~~gnl/TRDRNA2_/TRDRNA2_173575_c0_seq4.p1  ORF type:complete len:156 (+),score=20.63 gnl/TRDRNA2_/TRDRNA2_173575_c0_seq4:131-598(+)
MVFHPERTAAMVQELAFNPSNPAEQMITGQRDFAIRQGVLGRIFDRANRDGLLIAPPPGPRPGSRSSPRRRLHERKPHHSVESQAEPMMCDEVVSEGEGSLCEEKSTYHPPQLLKSSTRARSRGARSEDSTSHPAGSALHTARALRHVEGLYGAK